MGLFKNKKGRILLGIDIGTEAVKSAVFLEERAGNCRVLGYSSCYYEKYGVFDTQDFFKDLLKNTLLKAVEEAERSVALSGAPASLKKRVREERNKEAIITLSPLYLKSRTAEASFRRKNKKEGILKKEEKNIKENILFQARKKVSDRFAKETGILPAEIEWISFNISTKKVDGYKIADLIDQKGENLDFEIMAVFSPKYYLQRIRNIFKEINVKIVKVAHLAESIAPREDGLFLDIGGTASQGICFKDGAVREIFDFNSGGHNFTEALSENLGIDEATARNLKERYSSKALEKESEKKIRDIFAPERRAWYNSFRGNLNLARLALSRFSIMGGGAETPDAKEALKESLAKEFGESEFSYSPEIKKLYPKDIGKGLEILTREINSTQATPLLFMCSNLKK